jgi:DNA-binding winged helix-turn-helix (wHTH) protein/TolB-like protein/tetratricopeptide (TPR) repeat protein
VAEIKKSSTGKSFKNACIFLKGDMPKPDNNLYAFDDFRLDPVGHALFHGSKLVPLTPKALDILLVLVRSAGHVVRKEELIQAVWPDTFVEEGNLNVNVFALRKALGESSTGQPFIETIPRRGYRFAAPVRLLVSDDDNGARAASPPVGSAQDAERHPLLQSSLSESPTTPSSPTKTASLTRWLLFAGIFVGALLALAWIYVSMTRVRGVDSIAVLPLVNATSDANLDYLTDGLTEGVIASLSELPNLKVMSRTSVYRYKGRELEPQAVGRELHVRAVLVGRMVSQGDGISLRLELIDVKDNTRAWGGQFDRRMADLPAVQDEIAYEISSKLGLAQRGGARAKPARHGTENPEAYQLYLKGRYFGNQLSTESVHKSAEYFHQALGKDPQYALAYDGLADYYSQLPYLDNVPPHQAFPRAKEYALKALELDDSLAEAHASLASIREDYDWDFAGAEQEYQRAIALNPNYSNTYEWYGHFLSRLGRNDEALVRLRQGLSVDPLSLDLNIHLATSLYFARRYDEALQQTQRTLDLDPQSAYAHFMFGLIYRQQGAYEKSIAEFKKAGPAFDDDSYVLGYLGQIYAQAGNNQAAQLNLQRLHELASKGYSSPVAAALIHFGLHQHDLGFAQLDDAYRTHDPYLLYLRSDPAFDSVRSDQRFQQLVRRIGL